MTAFLLMPSVSQAAESAAIGWLLLALFALFAGVVIAGGVLLMIRPPEHRNCGQPDE